MRRPLFLCVTNIPTPYRTFLFAEMRRQLAIRGWDFEVWFMARRERRRSSSFAPRYMDYRCRFLRGINVSLGSKEVHVNFSIRAEIKARRPDVLLIAGGWGQPTVWLSANVVPGMRAMFWPESHLGSIQHRGPMASWLRATALSRFREFVVPGVLAEVYVRAHVAEPVIYRLPNLVDPAVFSRDQRRNRVRRSRRRLLIVARLSSEKGIGELLSNIAEMSPEQQCAFEIRIAGSGPLDTALRSYVKQLQVNVEFLGEQSPEQIADLLANADGFCLPSLRDANPLSVIEALWAGVPLLLSTGVGNRPECLLEGSNGFSFDITSHRSTLEAISSWLELSDALLDAFGQCSRQIAEKHFEPVTEVSRFLDDVLGSSSQPTASVMTEAATSNL